MNSTRSRRRFIFPFPRREPEREEYVPETGWGPSWEPAVAAKKGKAAARRPGQSESPAPSESPRHSDGPSPVRSGPAPLPGQLSFAPNAGAAAALVAGTATGISRGGGGAALPGRISLSLGAGPPSVPAPVLSNSSGWYGATGIAGGAIGGIVGAGVPGPGGAPRAIPGVQGAAGSMWAGGDRAQGWTSPGGGGGRRDLRNSSGR